jgi:hypothetical protein
VWLPHYLVLFDGDGNERAGMVATVVDALDGAFSLLKNRDQVVEGNPDGEVFPSKLTPEEAVRRAREGLLAVLLSARGRPGRPVERSVRSVELLHYPFWVYYYPRWRGRLDFLVLDAVTGEHPGPRTKSALLTAFEGAG